MQDWWLEEDLIIRTLNRFKSSNMDLIHMRSFIAKVVVTLCFCWCQSNHGLLFELQVGLDPYAFFCCKGCSYIVLLLMPKPPWIASLSSKLNLMHMRCFVAKVVATLCFCWCHNNHGLLLWAPRKCNFKKCVRYIHLLTFNCSHTPKLESVQQRSSCEGVVYPSTSVVYSKFVVG